MKNFYSQEEVMEILGVTEEQIRTEVRNGKLREYRDGFNLIYKAEDVDSFWAKENPEDARIEELAQEEERYRCPVLPRNPVLLREENRRWWQFWK